MSVHNLKTISELAQESVSDTQLLMIMEYKNFESELWKVFAHKLLSQAVIYVKYNGGVDSVEELLSAIESQEDYNILSK
jgi:hypothetical protein